MAKAKAPVTAAIRVLRAQAVQFEPHFYDYVERGGTTTSSSALGVDEHSVIKTLIMQDDAKKPLCVLMHGDCSVATGVLAKTIGVKKVQPCDPKVAQKHSGYVVGGTSPFGLKKSMPIYAEASIQQLATLYINGGKRGFLVSMSATELTRVLQPTWVSVAQP